jgi:hypothetical protein
MSFLHLTTFAHSTRPALPAISEETPKRPHHCHRNSCQRPQPLCQGLKEEVIELWMLLEEWQAMKVEILKEQKSTGSKRELQQEEEERTICEEHQEEEEDEEERT